VAATSTQMSSRFWTSGELQSVIAQKQKSRDCFLCEKFDYVDMKLFLLDKMHNAVMADICSVDLSLSHGFLHLPKF